MNIHEKRLMEILSDIPTVKGNPEDVKGGWQWYVRRFPNLEIESVIYLVTEENPTFDQQWSGEIYTYSFCKKRVEQEIELLKLLP